MMDLLLGVVFIVALVVLVCAAVMFGLFLGAEAWLVWRHHQRDSLRARDSVARIFYGMYQSPFPWHKRTEPRDIEKGGAA